jgi:hypothetical protein
MEPSYIQDHQNCSQESCLASKKSKSPQDEEFYNQIFQFSYQSKELSPMNEFIQARLDNINVISEMGETNSDEVAKKMK